MKRIRIYIASDNRSMGRTSRQTACILEYDGKRGIVTREFAMDSEETLRGAALMALEAAAARIDEPVHATIYCDDGGLEATVRGMDALKERGFTKKDGHPAAHADQLRRISERIPEMEWGGRKHSYTDWMERYLEGRKECVV